MKEVNKNTEFDNTDKNLNMSDVRQRLINYIESRINYFSGGDLMKSLNESVRDEILVEELKNMKKIIDDDNFYNKADAFKKELKELLTKYNAEIYAFSQGDGFSSKVIIDIDNKEIMRNNDTISQWDIK